MKNKIDIDVTSFYQSGYKELSWTIMEQSDDGTVSSLKQKSVADQSDIHEAIKNHMDNITTAIQEKGDLMDYELTLVFDNQSDDDQKEQFTEIFNEYNTRDEPS